MIFSTPEADSLELAVIARIDELRQRLRNRVHNEPRRWPGRLRKHSLARGIRGSNSIEGYDITKNDALAAVEGDDPLETSDRDWQAATAYRNAMTFVLQLSDDPHFQHDEWLVRSLHYMMLQHNLDSTPGRYRTGPIFVFDEDLGEAVYEAPDEAAIPGLMSEFIDSLRSDRESRPLIRAAMAHLNLAMIHPFRDGNGRMARCIQTLVLARDGILAPEFSSIEEYLGRNHKEYYDVLARVGGGRWQPERDARPWIRFSLKAYFQQATTVLRRVTEYQRLWELLEIETAKRGLPERCIFALFDSAAGWRTRNATYRRTADISSQVASRDLAHLVEQGLLLPHGEKKGRFYSAGGRTLEIADQAREARPPMEDPFETTPPLQIPISLTE
ncbi:MAG: Fic family protein [Gemmatimonadota bacterium]